MAKPFEAGKCTCGCGKRTRKKNANGYFDHRVTKAKAVPKGRSPKYSTLARSLRRTAAKRATVPTVPTEACAKRDMVMRAVDMVGMVMRAVDTMPIIRVGVDTDAAYCAAMMSWVEHFRQTIAQYHVGVVVSYVWAAKVASLAATFPWQSKCDSLCSRAIVKFPWPTAWRAVVVALCVHAMKSEFADDDGAHTDLISALGSVVDKDNYNKAACELVTLTASDSSSAPGSKSLLVEKKCAR